MNEFLDDDDLIASPFFEQSPIENTRDDDSSGTKKDSITKHISSVISYFTNSKAAFNRQSALLKQIIFYILPSGNLVWASPKAINILKYSESEILQKRLLDFIHTDDRLNFLDYLSKGLLSKFSTANTVYIRMISKTGEMKLLEIKSKLSIRGEEYNPIILSYGREFSLKAATTLDGILDARVENLRLRMALAKALIQKGLDPKLHPLLQDASKDPGLSLEFAIDTNSDTGVNRAQKISGLYCRQCGVTESPEWRKGPEGKKTYDLFKFN